mmetsp:Transcript_43982/g.140103  ORF Transcript_43982/g.140103 Transcript_43982/m.140103 type:complete len:279 (-) Transcript_43982:170-1006(-)
MASLRLLDPLVTTVIGMVAWVAMVYYANSYLADSPLSPKNGELDAKSISFVHRLCCTIFATALMIDVVGLITNKQPGKWKMSVLICSVNLVAFCTYAGLSGGIFPTMRKYNGHRLEVMGHIEWCYTTPQLIILLSLYCGKEAPSRAKVLMAVFWDVLMIVTGFYSAYLGPPHNYIPFAISMLAFYFTLKAIIDLFDRATRASDDSRARTKFFVLKTNTVVMWSVFPVIWVLSDLGFLKSDTEASLFALADAMAKALWSVSVITEDKYNGGMARGVKAE